MSQVSHVVAVTSSPAYFPILAGLEPAVVLLVEDEEFVREMASGILESAGHHVFQASNAAEAMGLFLRYRKIINLLITDVVLPGKSGHHLAEEVRVLSPELKIMFISGYAENMMNRSCDGFIADAYLPKPFSAWSLLEKIEKLVH
jgi:two-component system, cell cycle sensor histidine kinase and response regulator CckA